MATLNKTTMLVQLSISQWYNRITDNRIAREVADKYEVSEQDDSYVKILLPRRALIDISKAISNLRDFHHMYTLPWKDGNVRILPSSQFFAYRQGIATRQTAFETAVDEFVANYPKWVDLARQSKKGLFDERQYPNASSIKQHFKVRMSFMPFPEANDFRVALDSETMDEIKSQTAQAIEEVMASATQSLIDRIYDRLYMLYNALKSPEKVFRDNTVTSVLETVDVVEKLNVMNNQQLALTINAIRASMQDVTADRLRQFPQYRGEVARSIEGTLLSIRPLPK